MKPLSHSGLDPCRAWEHKGTIYREIPASPPERWIRFREFVFSPEFREMQDCGWVPRHAEETVRIPAPGSNGAGPDIEAVRVERLPFVNRPAEWTRAQRRDALMRVFDIAWFLEDFGSDFRPCDPHDQQISFRETDPVYLDTGSFSHTHRGMFWMHVNAHFAHPLGMERVLTIDMPRKEIRAMIMGADVSEPRGEWSGYGQPDGPPTPEERWILERFPAGANDCLDIAGNAGRLARLIPIPCCSIDRDRAAVAASYARAKTGGNPVTSLVIDLASRKDLGWHDRLRADTVVASSVTHHLFRQGMEFAEQASLIRHLCRTHAFVEFVDASDRFIRKWNLSGDYTLDAFKRELTALGLRIADEGRPERGTRVWMLLECV